MFRINLQLFAHKKGVGSSRNGRESESKRLGPKRADGQFVLAGNILEGSAAHISIPAITSASVRTIRCLQRLTAFFALKPSTAAASASAFIPRKSQAELFTERILDSSADSGGV